MLLNSSPLLGSAFERFTIKYRHAHKRDAVQKELMRQTERVKFVEVHPTEPWVLAALYDGKVIIYDTNTGST